MLNTILFLLPSMLLGAQLILTVILLKGDICPGQRGRLHKTLPVIAILWLAVASARMEAFLVVTAIMYFYSQVQTGKTRDSGPTWLLHLANGLTISFVGLQMLQLPNAASAIYLLLMVLILGSLFVHLLLTVARTRLQAFHRLLPVGGIFSSILVVVVVSLYLIWLPESEVEVLLPQILTAFSTLAFTNVVWCWHLISGKTIQKRPLSVALLSGLVMASMFQPMLV